MKRYNYKKRWLLACQLEVTYQLTGGCQICYRWSQDALLMLSSWFSGKTSENRNSRFSSLEIYRNRLRTAWFHASRFTFRQQILAFWQDVPFVIYAKLIGHGIVLIPTIGEYSLLYCSEGRYKWKGKKVNATTTKSCSTTLQTNSFKTNCWNNRKLRFSPMNIYIWGRFSGSHLGFGDDR